MIRFEEWIMPNGLKVIVHEDPSTPLAALNILYRVGSRDESPSQTGFAHLFEHFMFEGSANIPDFDTPLQEAGGENNAFTTPDITNYYDILPVANIETAFWLESDRMRMLDFDPESLDTQKKVVCEEFKEHYINQPYGDVWHKLMALAYQVHPYRWPTIGLSLAHVEQATMDAVRAFFARYYHPANATLVVAGGVKTSDIRVLADKWFGDIPAGTPVQRDIPIEPVQTSPRVEHVTADVPIDGIYKAYKMCDRLDPRYQVCDLLRDILSTGDSSRLYQELVKEQKVFSSISAYMSETIDEGLFIIEARLNPDVTMEQADAAIQLTLHQVSDTITETELEKVKNKMQAYLAFSDTNVMNRATNLAYYDMLGNADWINHEQGKYQAVTLEQIRAVSAEVCDERRCSTIFYHAKSSTI
jgi:zinc protease